MVRLVKELYGFLKMNSDNLFYSYSVVFLGTQIAIGGAQKFLLEQALWFYSQGHKVTVIFFYDRDGLYDQWVGTYPFEIINLRAFDIKKGMFFGLPKFLGGLVSLYKILLFGKFDAVITFTHDSNVLGLPFAWLAGIPVRVGTHLGEIRGMPTWREKFHTILINTGIIQMLVASSTRTMKNAILHGVNPNRVMVIHNAIIPFVVDHYDRKSIRTAIGLDDQKVFFLSVGRLVYEKGHEFFVQAISESIRLSPNVVAGICGSGPLYDDLKRQISSLNAFENVKLLGSWGDIKELLAAADVFVLPSRWEGLPIALLEAMSAGLPVIATRVEGVDEVIEEGIHGFLAPVENAAVLSDAILKLERDPGLRKHMGMASKRKLNDYYSIDITAEKYLGLIIKLFERNNGK